MGKGHKIALMLKERVGKPRKVPSPIELWDHFQKYCAHTDRTPWTREEYKGKDAVPVLVKYRRPYTWHGFDNYLFDRRIFSSLPVVKSNRNGWYDEYVPVIERIEAVILENKMTGAYLGFFNPAIVAADLGLNKSDLTMPPGGAQVVVLNLGGGIDPNTGLPAPEPEAIRAVQDAGPKDYFIEFEEVEPEIPTTKRPAKRLKHKPNTNDDLLE